MTTIAWRGSVLASDSAITYGNTQGVCRKLIKAPGVAYGLAGDASSIFQFIDMIREGVDPFDIKIKGDFDCLMLNRDGCYFIQRNDYPIALEGDFWAIGSGSEFAIGAMAASKRVTARKAIEIACKYNPGTQPPISWARVRQRR